MSANPIVIGAEKNGRSPSRGYEYNTPAKGDAATPAKETNEQQSSAVIFNTPWAHLSPLVTNVVTHDKRRNRTIARMALNPQISKAGHILTTGLFVILMIVYAVMSLVLHFDRPFVEEFMQVPATDIPSLPIRLDVSCSNPPHCGVATVQINYTDVPQCAQKLAAKGQNVTEVKTLLGPSIGQVESVFVELCVAQDVIFTANTVEPLQLPGIVVDFSSINPGIAIVPTNHSSTGRHFDTLHGHETAVASPELKAQGIVVVRSAPKDEAIVESTDGIEKKTPQPMSRTVNVDSWQVKTLIIGQAIENSEGQMVFRQPSPVAIQYEGIRPNWRASLIINLSPFVNSFDKSRPGHLLTVVASIGGASFMLAGIFIVMTPLWKLMFGVAPTKDGGVSGKASPKGVTPQPTPSEPVY